VYGRPLKPNQRHKYRLLQESPTSGTVRPAQAGDHFVSSTFKAGLINFSVSDQNATSGFKGSLSDVTTGNTAAAIYPGLGVEGFFGPIGLRADVGDEIYFKNGTRNNLRVTFGPTIRF